MSETNALYRKIELINGAAERLDIEVIFHKCRILFPSLFANYKSINQIQLK